LVFWTTNARGTFADMSHVTHVQYLSNCQTTFDPPLSSRILQNARKTGG